MVALLFKGIFFFFLPCMLMAVFKSVGCIKRWDEASALKRRSEKKTGVPSLGQQGPPNSVAKKTDNDWPSTCPNGHSTNGCRHHDSVHLNAQSWSNLHPINAQRSKSGESKQ